MPPEPLIRPSLAAARPDLVPYWDEAANAPLTPSEVAPRSSRKVRWRCSAAIDHSWEQPVSGMTHPNKKLACPFCAGKRVSVTNSLATRRPDLAAQLDAERTGRSASDIIAGSGQKVWWSCPAGEDHRWEASPNARRVRGCPFCAGKRVSATNSLASQRPDLAAQLDTERSGFTASEVTPGSNVVAWWQCDAGPDHRWQATPLTRSSSGCPFCAGKRTSSTNSLLAEHPLLAAELDTDRSLVRPDDVTSGSRKRVWWKCSAGLDHRWEAVVADRVRSPGCPFCGGKRVSATNSLAARFPEIAAQLDVDRTGFLASEVTWGSRREAWWRCPEGPDHRWRASVAERASNGSGCPACAGYAVSVTNSLATRFPALAAQLATDLCGLDPAAVTAGAGAMAWWRCPAGPDHVWEARVRDRAVGGNGCPFCSGKRVSVTNSLAARFPHLVEYLDATRSGFTADTVTYGAKRRAWWRCTAGHTWQATVCNVTSGGRGCPDCARLRLRSRVEVRVAFELAHLLDVDPTASELVAGLAGPVDVLDRSRRLVIEYDGWWWHTRQQDKDRARNAALAQGGWDVLRIREHPLERLAPGDVLVPSDPDPFGVACVVFREVERRDGTPLVGLGAYIEGGRAVAARQAQDFLDRYVFPVPSGTGTADVVPF